MEKKYIQIIKDQIKKLEADDFDLEAWKASSIALLRKIFGNDDPKAKQIEQLKIDYSSWALRDSTASYKPVESCKRIGKEILETAIAEIEIEGDTEHEIPLADFFSKKDMKILMDEAVGEVEKLKIVRKLKKADLENLVLSIFSGK